MNKLKKIVCEFELNNVKKSLRKNAGKISEAVKKGQHYLTYYNEHLHLMSCNSYLENKLGGLF